MGGLINEVGSLFGGGPNNSQYNAKGTSLYEPLGNPEAQQAFEYAKLGIPQQQRLINALQAQNGIQNQANVFNQLQGVTNGTGPNPAQAMLNQATGANVANQAALMAGQRGANANVGLLARQAAQQGGALQQQAAGQGAVMQANQQLGALNQLGGIAGQQVGQQMNALQGYNQAAQGQEQNVLNSLAQQNAQRVAMQSNINNANSGMAQTNANNSAKAVSGLAGAVGGLIGLAQGGAVPNPKVAAVSPEHRFSGVLEPHVEHMARIYHADKYAGGGKVKAMVSPGEVYIPPSKVQEAKKSENPLSKGEKIPGKPKVKGNSEKNDVVPKELKAGGVVIPNSIMQSDDPTGNAAKFIQKLSEKSGEHGDFKEALKRAIANRKDK